MKKVNLQLKKQYSRIILGNLSVISTILFTKFLISNVIGYAENSWEKKNYEFIGVNFSVF